MNGDQHFPYRGETVELRRLAGELSIWISGVDRTDEILAIGRIQFWQESARILIDRDKGPQFTQTITTEAPNVTDKNHPTRGKSLIEMFDAVRKEQ